MTQRGRVDNLAICFVKKKQINVSFLCVYPVIDNGLRHNIVEEVRIRSCFDNVMTKFMITNRTDA